MKPHLQYLLYVIRHKWFVFQAGRRIGGIPLWRLLIHDWSKFTPSEWGPYARRFYAGDSGKLDKRFDPDDFHVAWTHHWHLNPHHWEHWITAEGKTLKMPSHFAREMVADWMGAGRAITGKWEAQQWYHKNKARIHLNPTTRFLVEGLLKDNA